MTREFVASRKAPFLATNRIWIGGYNTFGADVASYDALLKSEGVAHLTGHARLAPSHRWDGDWVKEAVEGLSRMSAEQS